MKKRAGILAGLVVLSVVVLRWRGRDGITDEARSPDRELESGSPEIPGLAKVGNEEEAVRVIERNPFLSDYGREGGSIRKDLEILRDVVRDCQLIFRDFDRYPLAGNPDVTAFLQGDNPDGLAWIPPGHSAVGPGGELRDRFGTPVFFHRLSGTRFEYRSAGPDRKLWSDDDVVVK
jgi:hypothetical protein